MATKSLAELYKSYRRKIDVRELLEHYQAENVTEINSDRYGPTLVHSCLLDRVEPHHANGDAHPSAWVNIESGLYSCATYWSGDILHLILKLEGLEELTEIGPVLGDLIHHREDVASVKAEISRLFARPVYGVELPSYSEQALRPWAQTHPYMSEVRGIGHETCQAMGIGFDPQTNRIVFPHWWDYKLVGWQKRAIPPGDDWPGTCPPYPKYKNSSGFPKSETLYMYHTALGGDTVIVVESPMSVAKAHELSISGVVATFGAKVSTVQIDLLKNFNRVIVWFDDDPAGYKGAGKLVEGLYRHVRVDVVDSDPDMDLGDYTDAGEVHRKLEEARAATLWLPEYWRHSGRRQGKLPQ